MKNTRKLLVALIVVMAMLLSMATLTLTASAADIPAGTVLYLVPSANWNESNARFAAYFFGNGEAWVSMTKVDGESNLYQCTVPAGSWTNVIFCRMNPGASANNWNNKWNQTSDLAYNGTSNCYTVKEGTWDKGGGTWSTYGNSCAHTNLSGAATCTEAQVCLDCGDPVVSALGHSYNADHLCTRCNGQASFTVAGTGAHLGTEWDTGNTANDLTYADGVYTIVYTNVTAGSYKFKVVRDHDWGTAYPDVDKEYTVSATGNTVTITLKGTVVEVKEETPHVHEFVEGKCECGETDPNYVPPHVHAHEAVVTAPTCTAAGYTTYTCACGDTYTGDETAALGHSFAEGACSVCGAEDPNYVPPHEHNFVEGKCECGEIDPDYVAPEVPAANDKLINFSTWPEFAKETYADGDVVKHNDIFTFIYGKNSRVDASSKTWDDFSGTLRFSLGGKTNDGVPTKNAIQITVDGAHTLKIWYVAGGDARYFELRDASGAALSTTTAETVKNGQYYGELELPAAGVYYLTIPADNQYIFQLELVAKASEPEVPHEHNFVDGKCECGETDPNYVPPHVNTLVVGDTNKIVVSGETLNDAGLPIEWVLFTADENAYYSFVGDNGALAFIFTADGSGTLVSATGASNLEAGYYLVCLGNGVAGEFNVAVTKSAWVEPPVEEHTNALVVGDNKFVVTDTLIANYIEYIVFIAEADGKYTFTASEGANFVFFAYTDAWTENWAYTDPAVSNKGTTDNFVSVNLKAGMYIVGVNYYYGGTVAGEYNVNVSVGEYEEGGNVLPEKNTFDLGDNHYVVSDALLAANAEWMAVKFQPGTYVVKGGAPLMIYVFYANPDCILSGTEAFAWNIDFNTFAFLDEFEFTIATEGTYWVGIEFTQIGDQREFDFNISLKPEEPEHEHNFVDGKCECGESDPNYVPPVEENPEEDKPEVEEPKAEAPAATEEAPKLNFFQKIWQAILNFFNKLFGKKN